MYPVRLDLYEMRRLLLFLIFLSNVSAASSAADGRLLCDTITSGGIVREFKLYMPDGIRPQAPLVMVLHGYGGSADPGRFGMNRVADRYGVAVCYPEGVRDVRGKRCWNVGYPFQADMCVDDVGFLCDLAAALQNRYALSRRDTFVTGLSNGGEMCYLLAYLRPDIFRAVVPVAGLMLEWFYRELSATRPVPLMEIHGTCDLTSLWCGDPHDEGGWGAYISVPAAVGYWVAADRCTHSEVDTLPSRSGRLVTRERYLGGRDSSEVWLYRIEGGRHSWGEHDIDTPEAIWEFFARFVGADSSHEE